MGCLIGAIVLASLSVGAVVLIIQKTSDIFSSASAVSTFAPIFGGSNPNVDATTAARQYADYGLLTAPLPNNADPAHFDTFAAYPQIVAFVGGDVAVHSMEIRYIRADGTMDLDATYSPAPTAKYEFIQTMATPPTNNAPVGAGGGSSDWYQTVKVTIEHPGATTHIKSSANSFFFTNKGMESETSHPENNEFANRHPTPTCAFTKLWSDAITKGAPRDGVATISYDGGGYSFSMGDIDFYMQFDMKCAIISVEGARATSTPKPR